MNEHFLKHARKWMLGYRLYRLKCSCNECSLARLIRNVYAFKKYYRKSRF